MNIKRTYTFLLAVSMIMVLISCNNNKSKKDSTSADTSNVVVNDGGENKAVNAKLLCRSLGEDSLGTPHADVILSVNGQERKIGSINSCAEIMQGDFKTYQIPDNASSAVGGFWAGLGSYYYLVMRDGKAVVFEGSQDEGQAGYNWKEITTL